MKYFATAFLFLLNNEVWSVIALNIIVIMFIYDILMERAGL